MKRSLVAPIVVVAFTMVPAFPGYGADTRPAMVASGGDSFASQLHYPEKAKAERKQAAIPFYCEIGADGKPTHIHTLEYKGRKEFTDTVDHALRKGLFQPAL